MLLFIHCFSMSSLTLPWAIAGFLHPFYTFSPAHRTVIRDTFILTFLGSSFTVLPRALRFWAGISTHRRFLPYAPSPHFYHNLLLSRPGSRRFFLEVCRASCWSSKHRPGSSGCLIYSNPQSWYSEEFVLKSYQILPWITCRKKFSLSAPYFVSNSFCLFKVILKTTKTLWTRLVLLITSSMKRHIKVILKKQPPRSFA